MGRLEEDGKTEGESVFVKNTSTCQVFSHSANSDLLDNVSNMSKNSAASIVFLILEREREKPDYQGLLILCIVTSFPAFFSDSAFISTCFCVTFCIMMGQYIRIKPEKAFD